MTNDPNPTARTIKHTLPHAWSMLSDGALRTGLDGRVVRRRRPLGRARAMGGNAMNLLTQLRSRVVNRLMFLADALSDRYAVDHECEALCIEDDDEDAEWCECQPLAGIRSRIAQTVRRGAQVIYVRWTSDILIRSFGWETEMEQTDTPVLTMMTRQRNEGR